MTSLTTFKFIFTSIPCHSKYCQRGFANSLAYINKPYCYMKFELQCIDLVQYNTNTHTNTNNWISYSGISIHKLFKSAAHCHSLSQSTKPQWASLKRCVLRHFLKAWHDVDSRWLARLSYVYIYMREMCIFYLDGTINFIYTNSERIPLWL